MLGFELALVQLFRTRETTGCGGDHTKSGILPPILGSIEQCIAWLSIEVRIPGMGKVIRGCHPHIRIVVPFGPNNLRRIQVSFHTTRRTNHDSSRSVIVSLVRRKPTGLRSGFVEV